MISLASRKIRLVFSDRDTKTAIPADGIERSVSIRAVQKLIG